MIIIVLIISSIRVGFWMKFLVPVKGLFWGGVYRFTFWLSSQKKAFVLWDSFVATLFAWNLSFSFLSNNIFLFLSFARSMLNEHGKQYQWSWLECNRPFWYKNCRNSLRATSTDRPWINKRTFGRRLWAGRRCWDLLGILGLPPHCGVVLASVVSPSLSILSMPLSSSVIRSDHRGACFSMCGYSTAWCCGLNVMRATTRFDARRRRNRCEPWAAGGNKKRREKAEGTFIIVIIVISGNINQVVHTLCLLTCSSLKRIDDGNNTPVFSCQGTEQLPQNSMDKSSTDRVWGRGPDIPLPERHKSKNNVDLLKHIYQKLQLFWQDRY